MSTSTTTLLDEWHALRAAEPQIRARDAAEWLGVSEGKLLDARRETGDVARLAPRGAGFATLIEGISGVGRIMTLTRNDAAVHETHGRMGEVSISNVIGQVTGQIDLRLFLSRWTVAYAVEEEVRSGLRRSIEVFDAAGTAVLKVYAVDGTDPGAWSELTKGLLDPDGGPTSFAASRPPAPDRPDAEIDVEALRRGWLALEHSHDFHALLHRNCAGRLQALRLVGEDLARPVAEGAVQALLDGAAASGLPIMCFVGNPGCIQIHSGPVQTIKPLGPWLNILDPEFNLHLRTDRIASVWRVVKPTASRGRITSIELFDAQGTMACQFFGQRAAGQPERPEWSRLVATAAETAS
ncbi:hemin-degrading factor [Limibaculum sp. M0105]|uniref:Hemin-degrading factor n=1 Tax=Thermohalobaculum xanthum TaxID=2753746 RepID=A0A8J7SAD3_9RHOB|nr:ChuX/HutX family heme-like substrate-binding protein [Thermohalobaculum xanthum]MBK0398252.1 hemin-degrading factor [Thermohalobaculum xanthum]